MSIVAYEVLMAEFISDGGTVSNYMGSHLEKLKMERVKLNKSLTIETQQFYGVSLIVL